MKQIMMITLAVLMASTAFARNNGQYAKSSPEIQKWFEGLTSRKGPCCSDADGTALTDTDWDSRDGHYRVFIEQQWWAVPDEAVITEPNRIGRTMVWPVYQRGEERLVIQIRCFMPGSMS